jgi:hypothetical protein
MMLKFLICAASIVANRSNYNIRKNLTGEKGKAKEMMLEERPKRLRRCPLPRQNLSRGDILTNMDLPGRMGTPRETKAKSCDPVENR